MSAEFATASSQVAVLKELYTGNDYMKDLVYPDNPFLALVPKNESPDGFAGKYIPVPLKYGNPQGRSATFATAQTNQRPTLNASFFVYRVKNYQLVSIENELLEATKNNMGAFVDEATYERNSAIQNITNDLALDLFGDATGKRGVFATGGISTGVITLDNPDDIVNFEVDMVLQSYSISGTTATISTGGALGYVIAVDRSAGTLTVSATQGGSAGTPSNWSTSFPYLAVEGDINFASGGLATALAYKISGLSAWLPATSPSSGESFWGVDRSVDPTRLAGVRYDASSQTIEEGLIDAMRLVYREGGRPDMCWVNYTSYAALEKSLGAKVQYVDVFHEEAGISFEGIRLHGPKGAVSVMPDRNCPSQTAFLLDMRTWQLRSLGQAPHILTYGLEGLEGLRTGSADALEIRIGYYANLICDAPGYNCRVTLSE